MAAKSTALDTALLQLIFNGNSTTTMSMAFINATSSPLSFLYASLHTATLTAASNQSSSEAAYGSYSRIAISRVSGQFTITGASVSPVSNIVFPAATSGTETETYLAIGVAASGASQILYFGALSPTIPVVSGVVPTILSGSTITES